MKCKSKETLGLVTFVKVDVIRCGIVKDTFFIIFVVAGDAVNNASFLLLFCLKEFFLSMLVGQQVSELNQNRRRQVK